MEFLDIVKTKLNNAGQEVTTQTKNLTEMAKISSEVSSNNKMLTELFKSIGERVYKENLNNPECSSYEDIQKISSIRERNESLQNKVDKMKGLMICPKCGTKLPGGSEYCKSCGSSLIIKNEEQEVEEKVEEKPEENRCGNCGTIVESNAIFCNHCGTKLCNNK